MFLPSKHFNDFPNGYKVCLVTVSNFTGVWRVFFGCQYFTGVSIFYFHREPESYMTNSNLIENDFKILLISLLPGYETRRVGGNVN